MLNWAARYFPILKMLRQEPAGIDSMLEVGSGSVGIGKFYRSRFVGCDIGFTSRPKAPMLAVVATAANLPFADQSFEAVVVSDVLEHVSPEQRQTVVREALRVARSIAIFAFPSGRQAFEYDHKLAAFYDRKHQTRPVWLQEHMQHPFPTEDLFDDVRERCAVTSFGNENLDFHYWVMRREMHRFWNYAFSFALTVAPGLVERALLHADREPCYRRIFVVRPRGMAKACTD